jgi:hypothetical protein
MPTPVPPPAPAAPRWGLLSWPARDRGVLAFLLAAAAALQLSALSLPFFADDYLFLDQVRHRSLPAVLAAPDPIGNFFRPLGRQIYFWTVAHLTNQSPAAFHVVNYLFFLAVVGLLFALVRRLAGLRAAAVAAAFIALHYAVDVPVRWVSGSQDLLATAGALGALVLLLDGFGLWAGVMLVLALLCKETVVLTPVIAVFVARRPGDSWSVTLKRTAPLWIAAALWAAFYVAMGSRHRGGATPSQALDGIAPALLHFAQTIVGAEWRADAPWRFLGIVPPIIPLALAITGVVWATAARRPAARPPAKGRARAAAERGARGAAERASADPGAGPDPRPAVWAGLVWALAGALPVAAVASIWSAYFYLFALCGAGLALGALLARAPRLVLVAAVALLGWGSENGRRLDEFFTSPSAWCVESHVNRFYLDRAMSKLKRYLVQLKIAHPTLPHNSTVYFNGVPSFLAWQVADGPLLRWAYSDSSLRGHYLTDFTLEDTRRGPVYFLELSLDTLKDRTQKPMFYKEMTISMVLAGKLDAALAALEFDLRANPNDRLSKYWLAMVMFARGDTNGTSRLLVESGVAPRVGPDPDVPKARARLAAGDTAMAKEIALGAVTRAALDPEAHAVLADAMLREYNQNATVAMEALAHRALAPNDPLAWRRWAFVQAISRRYVEAYESIQHYFAVGGRMAERDSAARVWRETLGKLQPGSALSQQALRAQPLKR